MGFIGRDLQYRQPLIQSFVIQLVGATVTLLCNVESFSGGHRFDPLQCLRQRFTWFHDNEPFRQGLPVVDTAGRGG